MQTNVEVYPALVGIGGLLQSGKSTAAEYLRDKYGYTIVAFADALKQELTSTMRRTLLVEATRVYGLLKPEEEADALWRLLNTNKTDLTRCMMQEWGTELRRHENPQYWVIKFIQAYLCRTGPVVCPDVRFRNEFEAIRHWKGSLIRIVRHGDGKHLDHASETSLSLQDQWDMVIVNDSSKDVLYERIDAFILRTLRGNQENP